MTGSKKTVEIYELDYEGEIPKYYLLKTVTEENKDELQLLHFPKIKITFDELFEEIVSACNQDRNKCVGEIAEKRIFDYK